MKNSLFHFHAQLWQSANFQNIFLISRLFPAFIKSPFEIHYSSFLFCIPILNTDQTLKLNLFFVCKSLKYAGDRILKITFLKAMKHDLINEKLKPFMLKLCPIFVSSFNDLAKRSKTIFFRFSFIAELWCLDRDRLLSWIDFSVFKKDIFTIQVSWFQNSWSILINSNF